MKGVYALLRDLTIFVFVLMIVLLLHYHSLLDFYKTNIENLLYGIYIFILSWIISSVLLLYTSFVPLETYYSYEAISKNPEKLQNLKRIYEDMHDEKQKVHPDIISQLQFQQMRQAFISPIELPILTECFLRRDFNFSMYLGYCITDFLSDIIGFINMKVYIFIAILLVLYKCINFLGVEPASGIIYGIPLTCFLILFLCKWHLSSVYKYLVNEVDSPHDIDFQVDLDIRDPYEHIDKIPEPPYLRAIAGEEERVRVHEPTDSDSEEEEEEEDSKYNGTRKPKERKFASDVLNDSDDIADTI